MKFEPVSLEQIKAELRSLSAEWLDEHAIVVVGLIPEFLSAAATSDRGTDFFTHQLSKNPHVLDVIRLLFEESQDSFSHRLGARLGSKNIPYSGIKARASKAPDQVAEALTEEGAAALIEKHLQRTWSLEDILVERYKMSRGRAIRGQTRGKALEKAVETILTAERVEFESGVTFTNITGKSAKCDLAIPGKRHPKIVIEVKGYEATGSKQTDFLGDILKIKEARSPHMYFFVVTDGRGWLHRESDLRRVVELHHEGVIDMIYTTERLVQLARDVVHIRHHEGLAL